jgi:hypothetical protein
MPMPSDTQTLTADPPPPPPPVAQPIPAAQPVDPLAPHPMAFNGTEPLPDPATEVDPEDDPEVPPPPPPTDQEVAVAAAARAASDPSKPSAPEVPSTAALDYVPPEPTDEEVAANEAKTKAAEDENKKREDGLHPVSGLDARLHSALDLARRGLAYASVNDLAKAVLLMLDMHQTPTPKDSPVAVAVAKNEAPALL